MIQEGAHEEQVMIAVYKHIASAAAQNGGEVDGGEENQGRIAKVWVSCQRGLQVFAVCFWHSEGWSSRKEAPAEAVIKSVDHRLS